MNATQTIYAASLGIPDTLFLMVLALMVFGPRRLPEIGRQIGKLMYEFRKVSNEFRYQMEEELRSAEEADRQRKLAANSALTAITAAQPQAPIEAVSLPQQASEAPVATAAVEEPVGVTLRPPSTGETVSAAHPFRSTEAAAEAAPIDTPVAASEAAHD